MCIRDRAQACFVGCDRVAANGDAANKIGTSGVAILAKHYGIPFYVLGPTSTIDLSCPDGDHIPIEQRDPEEIRSLWYREPCLLYTSYAGVVRAFRAFHPKERNQGGDHHGKKSSRTEYIL